MPFGLILYPAMFQALDNNVLWDMLNQFVFVNLDDIFIFCKNKDENFHHVQTIL